MLARCCFVVSALALLGACATYKGLYYDPTTGGKPAAAGNPQATVEIGTVRGAEIRSVNGRRVMIGGDYSWDSGHAGVPMYWEDEALDAERDRRQEYHLVKGPPGRYELEVGLYSSKTTVEDLMSRRVRTVRMTSDAAQRLTPFDAAPGRYWATIVRFKRDGKESWVAVVIPKAGQRIVAAPDPALVGLTIAQMTAALEGGKGTTLKELLDKALEESEGPGRQPSAAEQHYATGRQLYGQRDFPGALKELDRALALDPALDAAHVYRGIVLSALRRPADALQAIERGMQVGREQTRRTDAWFWWPQHHRGLALMQMGRIEEAVAAFDEEVRLNPTARAFAVRGAARIEQARQARRHGNAQAARAHLDRAAADLEQAAARDANDAFVWNNKAMVHFELNDERAACDAAIKACQAGDCRLAEEFTECRR